MVNIADKLNFYFSLTLNLLSNSSFVPQKDSFKTDEIYSYNWQEKKEQKRQAELYKKYCNFNSSNPYYQFINSSFNRLSEPASNESKYKFDCLFDNLKLPWIWDNYQQLETDLTNTKLSSQVTNNINWESLFQQIHLNSGSTQIAKQQLFRFYNIIGKIYGKKVVLKLVQNASINVNLSWFSKINYSNTLNVQTLSLNHFFANQEIINTEFQGNKIATNSIIIAPIHEYGISLSNYALSDYQQRQDFNKTPFNNVVNKKCKKITNVIKSSTFKDVVNSLIWFLNTSCSIETSNDKVKNILLPQLIVKSKVGSFAWINNKVNFREEFFAEAFTRWIGTKSEERDYRWELINDFFISFFPRQYNI